MNYSWPNHRSSHPKSPSLVRPQRCCNTWYAITSYRSSLLSEFLQSSLSVIKSLARSSLRVLCTNRGHLFSLPKAIFILNHHLITTEWTGQDAIFDLPRSSTRHLLSLATTACPLSPRIRSSGRHRQAPAIRCTKPRASWIVLESTFRTTDR